MGEWVGKAETNHNRLQRRRGGGGGGEVGHGG